ncbi:MAG TPA: hypothetical protein VLW85_13040, partial [Myxococcales bacterium]|nr:hypothetical protein [Myxococcales bacterium]
EERAKETGKLLDGQLKDQKDRYTAMAKRHVDEMKTRLDEVKNKQKEQLEKHLGEIKKQAENQAIEAKQKVEEKLNKAKTAAMDLVKKGQQAEKEFRGKWLEKLQSMERDRHIDILNIKDKKKITPPRALGGVHK